MMQTRISALQAAVDRYNCFDLAFIKLEVNCKYLPREDHVTSELRHFYTPVYNQFLFCDGLNEHYV